MRNLTYPLLVFTGLVLLAALVYRLPPVYNRLSWRADFALTYLRGVIDPPEAVPTALPQPRVMVTVLPATVVPATPSPLVETDAPPTPASLTSTPATTPTASPTPTPLPAAVSLTSPTYEKQDINNCGPASLAMYLRYYGWEGDQFTISDLLKPQREDRNVNVEELAFYVRNHAGWLNVEYRVGGDLELLKKLLAAGLPVMIEESFRFEDPFWPNDDLWAAHYFVVTGYDDEQGIFTGQDSFYGPDRQVTYETLDEYWQSFNRVYILVYPPEQDATLRAILGTDWDPDANRQHALEIAQAETGSDPENAFAWFNLGTNLVYFERYSEAAAAYDTARNLGLPQRMLRYQFGPFLAYFHSGRQEDLFALTEYALQRTPNAEEALLWHGWALYRDGNTGQAIEEFRKALQENPTYQDAQYALDFVGASP